MIAHELLQQTLASGEIQFVVDDLAEMEKLGCPPSADPCFFPRLKNPGVPGLLHFSISMYRAPGSSAPITEEDFQRLPESRRAVCKRNTQIHVTKATWEVKEKDAAFVAQLMVDAYNKHYPERAVDSTELWSERAKSIGCSDLDLFYVDRAEQCKNSSYLQKLACGISREEDPQGNLSRYAAAALNRLEGKS